MFVEGVSVEGWLLVQACAWACLCVRRGGEGAECQSVSHPGDLQGYGVMGACHCVYCFSQRGFSRGSCCVQAKRRFC